MLINTDTNINTHYHLELKNIETLLVQHPDVQEVVVIDREEQTGNKRRVAYIVSDLIPDRLPYQITCLVELEQNTMKLRTKDISYNGFCLVEVPPIFEKGKCIRIRVLLPGNSEGRWLNGTIVWHHEQKAGIQLNITPTEQAIVYQSINYLLETQGLLKVLQRIITRRLRQYLMQSLSMDIIPQIFVILPTLPLTANNQIDIHALPAPEATSWIEQSNDENDKPE